MGASYFPKELLLLPPACVLLISFAATKLTWYHRWLRRLNNVVIESHHKTGGHFAAYERPEALVEDVRKMFAKGGPAFAIVPGRSGYA